jgi:hypothetical protein
MDAADISFTQAGSGAVTTNLDALLHQKVYTPEMFGAVPSPLGTAPGSVADSTDAMQACINALAAIGGGTIQLGPGVYGITTVLISTTKIYIQGAGMDATTIMHIVPENLSCLVFSAGAAVLSDIGVSDLTIGSADTTFNKIAINMFDVSMPVIRNVAIGHYPWDGTLYRGADGIGAGIVTQGRELGVVDNVFIYASKPLQIAINPNSAVLSLDSWTFKDFIGYAGSSTTNSVITVDSGVVMANVTFCGHQNWIGGLDGFHWIDGGSVAISEGLYLYGIKSEQTGDAAGYTVNIQHNTALYGLHIGDGIAGDRNGIRLRKVSSSTITNFFYDANSNPNKIGLNIDGTDPLVQLVGCTWIAGTLLTMSGLTMVQSAGLVTGFSTAIPSSAVYTVTGSGYASTNGAVVLSGSGAPALSAPQGALYLRTDGSSTSTRAYINTNGSTGWTNLVTAA